MTTDPAVEAAARVLFDAEYDKTPSGGSYWDDQYAEESHQEQFRILARAALSAARDAGPERTLGEKLVSPNGFDGSGPVPEKVRDASKRIARLRVKFVTPNGKWTTREIEELFKAAAVQAEWMRELYEAVHSPDPRREALERVAEAARELIREVDAATSDNGESVNDLLAYSALVDTLRDLEALEGGWQ